MNFHVYLEPELADRLAKLCQKSGKPRNALVREALSGLLDADEKQSWPDSVASFRPLSRAPRFESQRKHLKAPTENIW